MAEYTMYDWFRDIWIPLLGAVAIPVLVWILTRYYGADKAEERKELRQLRDNLNFLVSVSLASLNTLIFLGNKIKEILAKEQIARQVIFDNLPDLDGYSFDDICYGFLFDNVYDIVDETKYISCIENNKDFVVEIIRVKSLLSATEAYIKHRNNTIGNIANCENIGIKLQRCNAFLQEDYVNLNKYIMDVYRIAILLKQIIAYVDKLNISIQGLNLLAQSYTQEHLNFLQAAENEYNDYLKKQEKE